MIKFIKILSYQQKPDRGDIFEQLCDLTSQKIDPPSLFPESLDVSADIILSSTLKRAKDCFKKNEGEECVYLPELKEVPFALDKICSKEEWIKEKSVAVRRNFKKAFINDQLLLSRRKIFDEIRQLLSLCKKKSLKGEVAVISHSFRLALIEAYIKTKGEIEINPDLIHQYISDEKKRYEFGEGFTV